MKYLFGEPSREGKTERQLRELDFIENYSRRRLREESIKAAREDRAKPPFSFTKFLGMEK